MQRGSIVKVPVDLDKTFTIPLWQKSPAPGDYAYYTSTGKELYARAARATFVFLARDRHWYYCTSPQGGACLYKFRRVIPVTVRRYAQYLPEITLRRKLYSAPVHVQQLSIFE